MAQSQPVPFTSKGLVQKKDPALLGPGEHYQFENAQSIQEGALTARYGHQQQVPANAPVVSLSKLNLGGADPVNPRYLGSGTAIFRTTPSYYGQGQVLVVSNAVTLLSGTPFNTQWPGGTLINLGGTNYTITTVNSPTSITLSTSTSTGSNVPYYIPGYAPLSVFSGLTGGQRWSAIQYNAGTAGTPALYFATTTAALRENGAYTTLQKWGIDPPPVPAIAYPGSPGFAEVGSLPASTGSRFIASVDANASDGSHPLPWKNVIAVQVLSPAGGSTGYTKITPDPTAPTNGLNGIYVGMHITISDPVRGMGFWEDTVVLATDTTSLYVWTVFSHPLADGPYLTAGYASLTVPGSIFNGSSPDPLYTLNAAYNGLASTGYDSSDVFHIGIYFSNATAVTNVAVQIVPNYQGTPYASDYYQYNIVPSSLNLSTNSPTAEVWTELVIPKTSFTKIGNAGTGAYNWSNINQVYIVATGTSSTIKISGLFFVGGGGLNSAAAGNTNYDYMYTYRNPTNQAEGNPSPLMIPANQPPILSNGSMLLTLTGTAGSVGSEAGGIWELSGPGSIKIYRRGGTFSDGFYRHVGYAANPGGGATVTFTDTASDQSLDQADTLQFDNDPPVPSNLITPLTGTIISFQPAGGGADSETSAETVIYGTVNTSGTAVTWVSGITFDPSWATLSININGVVYTISAVTDPTDIVLTATAGTQTGVNYFMPTLAQTSQMTNGFVRMVLNKLPTNFIASTIASTITIGSTLQVGFGLTFEQVIITAIGYNTTGHTTKAWVEAYLQYNHAQSDDATQSFYDPSDTVECDAILRGCCDLVHEDFDTIFLGGDPRNTAALYQSKVGRPESFPVVNLENNVVQQVNVGSPSNPINGIASLGPGEIICLNLNNLFIVQLWNNVMQQPMRAPATRGLYSKWCWTKGDNKLWYLGYDGIYAWAGGEGQKVSEQIDYMFKNQTVNGIAPIDYTLALQFSFAYAQNALYVVVIDVNSTYRRLRFETLYNRWTTETIYQAASGSNTYAINALFTEPDTGNLLVAVTNPGA